MSQNHSAGAQAAPPAKASLHVEKETLEKLSGVHHNHFRYIEEKMNVSLKSRGEDVLLEGDAEKVAKAERLLKQMAELVADGFAFTKGDLKSAIRLMQSDSRLSLREFLVESKIAVSSQRTVLPRSLNQQKYVRAIQTHDIAFGVGPAGTGKTYLAVAMAVEALNQGRVRRIVLARPAVEAGERLGFLPGTLAEKVDPYLRPLYDALYDLLDPDKTRSYLEKGIIEIAAIAFLRGRTLNDSFIILDEAQNTTGEQMKMFLTRMGFNSKTVVTGDDTQIDLSHGTRSGLVEVQRILANVQGIAFVRFTDQDVVRHTLVQTIIQAYEQDTRRTNGG
jgi:phosphate starvation-inducible PhoH-like protein